MTITDNLRAAVNEAFDAKDVAALIEVGTFAKLSLTDPDAEPEVDWTFLCNYARSAYRVLTFGPDTDIPVAKPVNIAPLAVGFYTVTFADGEYVTLRIQEDFRDKPDPGTRVAGFLSGPNNTSDYTGFAFVVGGRVRTWKRYQGKLSRQHEALAVLMGAESVKEYGKAYAQVSGNCYVCGRTLTTPESIAAGIGPVCAEKGL